jgi:hypothetical protein
MKEFFENNNSDKILEASEEVLDMMEDCMTTAEAEFHGIAAIISKDTPIPIASMSGFIA